MKTMRKTVPHSPSWHAFKGPLPPERKRAHLLTTSTFQASSTLPHCSLIFPCHPPSLTDFKFQLLFQNSQLQFTVSLATRWMGTTVGAGATTDFLPASPMTMLVENRQEASEITPPHSWLTCRTACPFAGEMGNNGMTVGRQKRRLTHWSPAPPSKPYFTSRHPSHSLDFLSPPTTIKKFQIWLRFM